MFLFNLAVIVTHAKMASKNAMLLFALKMPNHAPFWHFLGESTPKFKNLEFATPKGTLAPKPRRLSVFCAKIVNRYGRGAIREKKKKKEKKKKSHSTCI